MTDEVLSRPPDEVPRWPAAGRLPVYALAALGAALGLNAVTFMVERASPDGLGSLRAPAALWADWTESVVGAGGFRNLAADVLCVVPWVLAAFSRPSRLAARAAGGSSLRWILALSGIAVVLNLAGQTVRLGGTLDAATVRPVAALAVGTLPPYLAFVPLLVVLGRLGGGGFGALAAALPLYLLGLLLSPAFEPRVYHDAQGQLLILPASGRILRDTLAPTLGVWGIFTLLELRVEATARRR